MIKMIKPNFNRHNFDSDKNLNNWLRMKSYDCLNWAACKFGFYVMTDWDLLAMVDLHDKTDEIATNAKQDKCLESMALHYHIVFENGTTKSFYEELVKRV